MIHSHYSVGPVPNTERIISRIWYARTSRTEDYLALLVSRNYHTEPISDKSSGSTDTEINTKVAGRIGHMKRVANCKHVCMAWTSEGMP